MKFIGARSRRAFARDPTPARPHRVGWLLVCSGLLGVVACGRVGFEPLASSPSDAAPPAPPDAAAPPPDAADAMAESPGLGDPCGFEGAACAAELACVSGFCNCTLEIKSDEFQTCGLDADGALWCWGDNTNGEIGTGEVGGTVLEPARVVNLPEVVEHDLGAFHACAGTPGGELWCWGGYPGETPQPTPSRVADVPPVVEIASGGFHVCVLGQAGDVYCAGRNNEGQLGQGLAGDASFAMVKVPDLSGVRSIASGGFHTCALLDDGTVSCWGRDDFGQIGDGQIGGAQGENHEPSPRPVVGLDQVVQLSAGDFATCARRADGAVWCWGRNDQGQVGDGALGTDTPTPAQVLDLAGAIDLYVGDDHACAIDRDGALSCWGLNNFGQLGSAPPDPETPFSDRAIPVPALAPVVDTALGRRHTCALTRAGELLCWGRNIDGEHGRGDLEPVAAPSPTLFSCAP